MKTRIGDILKIAECTMVKIASRQPITESIIELWVSQNYEINWHRILSTGITTNNVHWAVVEIGDYKYFDKE